MPKSPQPRLPNRALRLGDTWLETEELCYPNDGLYRRARVRCPDGKLRVVKATIASGLNFVPAAVTVYGRYIRGRVFIGNPTLNQPFEVLFDSRDWPNDRKDSEPSRRAKEV